jgi:hypothetical protein
MTTLAYPENHEEKRILFPAGGSLAGRSEMMDEAARKLQAIAWKAVQETAGK